MHKLHVALPSGQIIQIFFFLCFFTFHLYEMLSNTCGHPWSYLADWTFHYQLINIAITSKMDMAFETFFLNPTGIVL